MTRPWIVLLALSFASTALAADKKVERLFSSKCASCHGKDGFKADLKPGDVDALVKMSRELKP
jgi:mono/diheme cytochrome c family protein